MTIENINLQGLDVVVIDLLISSQISLWISNLLILLLLLNLEEVILSCSKCYKKTNSLSFKIPLCGTNGKNFSAFHILIEISYVFHILQS